MSSKRYWTPDRIRSEALKHPTRYAFFKAAPGAYRAATDLGIREEVCGHMVCKVNKTKRHKPYEHHSDAALVKELEAYDNRAELRQNNTALLAELKRRGMTIVSPRKPPKTIFSKDEYEEYEKPTPTDPPKEPQRKRIKKVGKIDGNGKFFLLSADEIMATINQYETVADFRSHEPDMYKRAKKRKIIKGDET